MKHFFPGKKKAWAFIHLYVSYTCIFWDHRNIQAFLYPKIQICNDLRMITQKITRYITKVFVF